MCIIVYFTSQRYTAEAQGPHFKMEDTCNRRGLARIVHSEGQSLTPMQSSQIIRALKSNETFRKAFVKNQNPVRKRHRLGKEIQVDEKVLQSFVPWERKGVELTGPLITEKAQEISKELNCPEFTYSWLKAFKIRHHIWFKKLYGES